MKELVSIQSKLVATKDKKNEFGGFNYRNCESILAAVKPLLLAEQCYITLSDEIMLVGDRFYIKATATIHNVNGEVVTNSAFAREHISKKGMDEAQVTGACSSYARKYALCGLLAIDDSSLDPDSRNNLKDAIENAFDIDELNELWQVRGADINGNSKLLAAWQKRYGEIQKLNAKEEAQAQAQAASTAKNEAARKKQALKALSACNTNEDIETFLSAYSDFKDNAKFMALVEQRKAEIAA